MNRTISLPEALLKKAEELAARDHVSLEEFLASRLSEQLTALDYLHQRAARSSHEKCQAALDRIPDADPEPQDRL